MAVAMLLAGAAGACPQETATGGQGSSAPTTAKNPNDTPATQSTKTEANPKEEVSSKDTGTTFKVRVNLVQVRVVVRDNKGKLVEGLKREDFQLLDQGKPQVITNFAVETLETRRQRAEAEVRAQQQAELTEPSAPSQEKLALPHRFVALVFDDIHLCLPDATFVRSSAHQMIESLAPTDRLAIYTTSEQVTQEFTSNKTLLEQKLLQIVPWPKLGDPGECPDQDYYLADLALNQSDPLAMSLIGMSSLSTSQREKSEQLTHMESALVGGDTEISFTYRALGDVIRRLRGLPGDRVLVLASPGFLSRARFHQDEMDVIDQTSRAGIVINTLDARGLYAPDLGNVMKRDNAATLGPMIMFRLQAQAEYQRVLADFANGTGGTFFHNSNDLAGGLIRAAEAPEISYILGFSPQNQKLDGKYHAIKVTLVRHLKYDIQARRGYYAPKKADNPLEQARQEIAEALFSQEEIQELALNLQIQYFKDAEAKARLSVVSKIGLDGMHFRKADGRNWDALTVATAVFDENGNFVTGTEKVMEMKFLDKTYEKLTRTGLALKLSFDVTPGRYMVRQVIRDSEGAQMAARNGAIEIPR